LIYAIGKYSMSNQIKINIGFDELAWFDKSPEAGDPDCICS